ncbi:MAG: glycosyltransferase [Cyanobacteria bacterium J06650_10]
MSSNEILNLDAYKEESKRFREQSLWDKALSLYLKIEDIEPNNWENHVFAGDALVNLERWEEAAQSYEKSLTLKADFDWALHNLGFALAKLGQWDRALGCYQKLLELKPEFWDLNEQNYLVQQFHGDILARQEQWGKSIVAYLRAKSIYPTDPQLTYKLGLSYFSQGDSDQALLCFQEVIRLDPGFEKSQTLLAQDAMRQIETDRLLHDTQVKADTAAVVEPSSETTSPPVEASRPSAQAMPQDGASAERAGASPGQRKALRNRILLFDSCKQTHNHYIMRALLYSLQKSETVEFAVLGNYRNALELISKHDIDILIVVGGSGGDYPLLSRLVSLSKCSVLWTTEDPYELSSNVRLSSCFDLIYTNDLASVPAYMGRAKHLPLAASSKYHDLEVIQDDDRYRYDFLFLGTAWPNRVKTINRIIRSLNRPVRPKIGLPYNQFLPIPKLYDPDLISNWRTSNPNFAQLANRSRIVLCLFRDFSTSSSVEASGSTPPPRLFEVAHAGGFQLAAQEGREISRYFNPGEEIVLYKDESELVEKIAYYLDHPDERIKIATAARDRATKHHLYTHRIAKILSGVEKFKAKQHASKSAVQVRQQPHILVVTHNVLGKQSGGGVEVYQEQFKQQQQYQISYLYPEDGVNYVVRDARGRETKYPVAKLPSENFLSEPHREQSFQRILIDHQVDLVHFQHLLGHPLSLPLIAKAMGLSTIYTLHDYYLLCKRFNLLDYRFVFCDIAGKSPSTCDICLSAENIQQGSQSRRKNFMRLVAASFDVLLANTAYSRDYFLKIYPEVDADKVKIVEMLMPSRDNYGISSLTARNLSMEESDPFLDSKKSKLKVVIPGNFTDVKGGNNLIRVFNLMRNDAVEFHVLGRIQDPLREIINTLNLKNVFVRGGYQQGEVLQLLSNCDVSLHLSIWPETYVISLSEAWLVNVVPIVTDVGAQGERVRHGETGLKVPLDDIGAIVDSIRRLNSDRAYLKQIKDNLSKVHIVGTAEHLLNLQAIYDTYLQRNMFFHKINTVLHAEDFNLKLEDLGIRLNHPRWDTPEILSDQRLEDSIAALEVSQGFLEHLPTHHASLPVAFANFDQDAQCVFEIIQSDDAAISDGTESLISAQKNILLKGWAYEPDIEEIPTHVYVRFQRGHICRIIEIDTERRVDQARTLKISNAEMCGFYGYIDLLDLVNGVYDIVVIQVYQSSTVWYQCPWRLFVGQSLGSASRNSQSALEKMLLSELPPHVQSLPVQLVEDGAHIDLVCEQSDKNVSVRSSAAFSVSGWAFDRKQQDVPPNLYLRFEHVETKAAFFLWANRHRRPDVVEYFSEPAIAYAGFSVERSAFDGPKGEYLMAVIQVTDTTLLQFDTAFKLSVE